MSVTPADSIATSVPVPMATPTSAEASAGASLTPSPTIATALPSAWRRADLGRLLVGPDVGQRPGRCPPRAAIASAVSSVVAGQHRRPSSPSRCSSATAAAEPGLERVRDGDDPGRPPVDGDEDRASCPSDASCARPPRRGPTSIPRPRGTPGRPTSTSCPSTVARDALAGDGVEGARDGRSRARARRGVADDRLAQRVLRPALGGRDQGQQLGLAGCALGAARPR